MLEHRDNGGLGSLAQKLPDARAAVHHWWRARSARFRKFSRTAALLLLMTLVSLVVGVSTATASSPLGPHEATWSTTLDSTLTVDLGPIGSVSMDSPAGMLGVEVIIGEIPGEADPDAVSADTLGQALSSDAAAYVALITHPELTIERGLRALADDALRRAGLIESVLLCLATARRLSGGRRLRRVRRPLPRGATAVLAATAAAVAIAVVVPAVRTAPHAGSRLGVLAGTPLEDARLSGRVADIVQAYSGRVTAFLEENTAFYTAAEANLRTAWKASTAVDGAVDVTAVDGAVDESAIAQAFGVAAARGTTPLPAGSVPGAITSTMPATATPTATPTTPVTGTWAVNQEANTTAVLSTDLHCNLDVISLTGVVDELAGADIHMDDGDLTMTGSQPEQVCVDALSNAVPAGVARVATIGNHDSDSTMERLRAQGWTVTDGTAQQVGGLTVLGDVDPDRTSAGGTVRRGEEDATQLGTRLAQASCQAAAAGNRVDVVLIHQPYTFSPLIEDGCAPLLVAGHVHQERGMTTTTGGNLDVAQLVSGAGKGGTSIGKVTEDAYLHVMSFNADGDLAAWRTVSVHADASVTVGAWQPVPAPEPQQ
ncbi:serine/threonine protein phosphatase [Actinomyces sp. MRS3W]|uniref:metallophosphoesterase family protein n=1 Tax=Actinomyces sp. MRS3W TaxID=2800796 RepID=UPI0028FD5E0B|nr:serine/threonine protein phosphatase [Actinomyces sp. MRS3W]MDU0348154.1 serine/threonine protein phosphatase [Actinomyces sp. MRS3W]